MKRWMLAGAATLALSGTLAARQVAGPAPRAARPDEVVVREMPGDPARALLPNVERLFDGYVRDGKMPGIVGAFGVGDRPTLFLASGRIADTPGAPFTDADSLWRVYSMTKPVTALAAMILVDEGKLRLDEPLSDVFPAFARLRVLTDPDRSLATRPAARPITMRHLLTHTAGLGYSIVTKGPLLHEYERLGIMPYASDPRTEALVRPTRPRDLATFANRVATLPLIADPGTRWSYSIGLDVMGAVIERVSGMRLDAFVQARIFAPLGMRSSFWQVPAGAAARLATNYAFVGDARVPLDPGIGSVFTQAPSFPYGGAGLVMSARDYDTFLHLLQDRGTLGAARIVRPETADLMMSNLLPAGVSFAGSSIAQGPGAPAMGYGAGGYVLLGDGAGGARAGTYGWSGAAGTQAWVNARTRTRATIMVNYFPESRWPVRAETARALAADTAAMEAARP